MVACFIREILMIDLFVGFFSFSRSGIALHMSVLWWLGEKRTLKITLSIWSHLPCGLLSTWRILWDPGSQDPNFLQLWTQHCPTIGQLDTALSNYWTVWRSTVRPLDSCTQHSPTIWQLDTTLTNHWTVGHNTDQPLDC